MSDNIIDLDQYRKRRIEEKTWPLTGVEHREYWKRRKEEKDARETLLPPPPKSPKKYSESRGKLESKRNHSDLVQSILADIQKDSEQYADDRTRALWGELHSHDIGEDQETADFYKNHPGWPEDTQQ